MNFLEQLAVQLREAQTQANGVHVALADVQDADIPVLLGLGFKLNRDDNTFQLEPAQVAQVISQLETREALSDEGSPEQPAETPPTDPSEADTSPAVSESPESPSAEAPTDASPPAVALSAGTDARIVELQQAVERAHAETRRVVRERREDRMLVALSQAMGRGVPGGVINLSRDMLTSLLDITETPTVLVLTVEGKKKNYDMFDGLVHLLSAFPALVPTDRVADGGEVKTPEELEDQHIIEAAQQLMASAK